MSYLVFYKGREPFFNTINFIKNRTEVAYILYINNLNLFILLDNPTRPRLIKELPTKDIVLEVSRALQEDEVSQSSQETEEASRSLQEEVSQSLQEGCEASRALQEEDEVSQASQSGGDS